MGWYIRKSANIGPIRLNLSKSGIGVSGGVKGFRVSKGPKGTYVHAGRGGLYYRKKISSASDSTKSTSITSTKHNVSTPKKTTIYGTKVKCTNPLLKWFLLGVIIAPFLAIVSNTLGYEKLAIFFIGILVVFLFGLPVVLFAKVSKLNYSLSAKDVSQWNNVCRYLSVLEDSDAVLLVTRETDTKPLNVKNKISLLGANSRSKVKTNVRSFQIKTKNGFYYFLPDGILECRSFSRRLYNYLDMFLAEGEILVPEEDYEITDAGTSDISWDYMTKDGSPDRRHKYNQAHSFYQFKTIGFTTADGMHLLTIAPSKIGTEKLVYSKLEEYLGFLSENIVKRQKHGIQ